MIAAAMGRGLALLRTDHCLVQGKVGKGQDHGHGTSSLPPPDTDCPSELKIPDHRTLAWRPPSALSALMAPLIFRRVFSSTSSQAALTRASRTAAGCLVRKSPHPNPRLRPRRSTRPQPASRSLRPHRLNVLRQASRPRPALRRPRLPSARRRPPPRLSRHSTTATSTSSTLQSSNLSAWGLGPTTTPNRMQRTVA